MCIRWGNIVSSSFCVSNGVKQGGILSPTLFNVYMDSLSASLNSTDIGGGAYWWPTFESFMLC